MIRTFRCEETAKVARREFSKRFQSIARTAQKRLDFLNVAATLKAIQEFRGLRLEALHGDRLGQYSIRVNDQYRICFEWRDEDAWEVEIVDYH